MTQPLRQKRSRSIVGSKQAARVAPVEDVQPETKANNARVKVRAIDVFNVECPAHQVVARIGKKWTLLVLYALSQRTKRYTELQKQIANISPKMLTQVLRNLETDRLISRKIYPTVPPMVEYSLTPLGESLAEPLAGLCIWANDNYAELANTWQL